MYNNTKGVSNSLVAILIVVALMVVIAATIVIVDGTQKANAKAQMSTGKTQSSGLIQLNIAAPTHKTSGTMGMVTLHVE
jgi:type II secretory pathway component PulK